MTRAYDRVKNTDNHSDMFMKTPYWDSGVEEAYEVWLKSDARSTMAELVPCYLSEGIAVSFRSMDGSICCTLAHQSCKDAGDPYLLTGWADSADDAILVATYKLSEMLHGVWEALPPAKVLRRR